MIVCVEGPTGGGKTSLVSRFPSRFRRCPPVSAFIGGFPLCGTGTIGVELNCAEYLLGEIDRTRFMSGRSADWVLDRDWVSQVTFLMAVRTVCELPLEGAARRVVEAIRSGCLAVPDAFIYLRCNPALTLKRRMERGTTEWGDVPQWLHPEGRARFRHARHEAYEKIFDEVPFRAVQCPAEQDIDLFTLLAVLEGQLTLPGYDESKVVDVIQVLIGD